MCTKAVQSGAVFPVMIGLITSWTAIGRGTENTGRFVFDIEDRHAIGPRTPNSLGRQISTLQPTANLFNDRGFVVRDLFYVQRLVEGQVRFLIGRARDERHPGRLGVSLVADQQLNETVQVFARWDYADGAVANIQNYLQGGVGFRGLLGEPNDMAGIAFSYAFPSDSSWQHEKVLEGFYRWQLTRFSQASVGAQAIFDPGNGPDHDVVGAFWGRLRIVF